MRDQYHRKEVQAFVVASEQLYKLLSEGHSLSVCETEAILCCLDELLVQGNHGRPKTFYRIPVLEHRSLFEE